jgi:excisionase family DNA binding protein
MPEKLLDLKEVTARLNISRTTLYNLIEKGEITPVEKPSYLKKRGKVQFRESDVEKLLQEDPSNYAA